jgi:hypothetical protein
LFTCFAVTAVASADPVNAAAEATCFDAEVSATIVRQTPTVMPECDDCIIMRWPWIIDLRVRRVHAGHVQRGPLAVITIQHGDYRADHGARRWLLRRNTLGSFNASVNRRKKPSLAASQMLPRRRPSSAPPTAKLSMTCGVQVKNTTGATSRQVSAMGGKRTFGTRYHECAH